MTDINDIPFMSEEMPAERRIEFPLHNLIDEIVAARNMSEGFDYVIGHLEEEEQRERFRPKKKVWNEILTKQIKEGKFRVKEFRTLEVKDGPKARIVQAPKVFYRVGVHDIMVVVEGYCYQTLIRNTGASIKGRGMHWLHHIVEDIVKADPEGTRFYYQCDIHHYYDSIEQDIMKAQIRQYVADPVLLPMLDSFVELMPQGLSKGLRSSQTFANLHLSPIDHKLSNSPRQYYVHEDRIEEYQMLTAGENEVEIDGEMYRFYYFRYCDDIVLLASEKKTLWKIRDMLVEELAKLHLHLKPNEAVRPLTEGLDYLGYVQYPTHSLLRKRIKKKAARRLAKIKSRKRRQKVIGSFKGMACHADCKHLFHKLTGQRMKKFSEMGIVHTPKDGKKRFNCEKMTLGQICNRPIIVLDFERDVPTPNGNRHLVKFRLVGDERDYKFFTNSEEMKDILEQVSQMDDGFPFETTIQQVPNTGGLRIYRFT